MERLSEEEIYKHIKQIELVPYADARNVMKGSVEADEQLHILLENKKRLNSLIHLLSNLWAIKNAVYYEAKKNLYDALTETELENRALVKSNKDSYVKACLHKEMEERDIVESRKLYYIGMEKNIQESINVYKKTREAVNA